LLLFFFFAECFYIDLSIEKVAAKQHKTHKGGEQEIERRNQDGGREREREEKQNQI